MPLAIRFASCIAVVKLISVFSQNLSDSNQTLVKVIVAIIFVNALLFWLQRDKWRKFVDKAFNSVRIMATTLVLIMFSVIIHQIDGTFAVALGWMVIMTISVLTTPRINWDIYEASAHGIMPAAATGLIGHAHETISFSTNVLLMLIVFCISTAEISTLSPPEDEVIQPKAKSTN